MRQLRRWKRLGRRSLTRLHKRTSMGHCRSCWNGTTSGLQRERITSKGTRVSCVYYQWKCPYEKVWTCIICTSYDFNERTNTLFYKNTSLTFFSWKGWCFYGVCLMGGHTQRENLFFPYLLPGARGANACTSLQARSDSVCLNRVQVLSIPLLLLACSQDWTCNLKIIVSLEALGTNACNCYSVWRVTILEYLTLVPGYG